MNDRVEMLKKIHKKEQQKRNRAEREERKRKIAEIRNGICTECGRRKVQYIEKKQCSVCYNRKYYKYKTVRVPIETLKEIFSHSSPEIQKKIRGLF
jgi:hypothetical protein